MDSTAVMVPCKKCGKRMPSTEFILDPVFKMMVCRNCYRARLAGDSPEAKKKAAEEKSRPAGWDNDDEFAAKRFTQKQASMPKVERIGADKILVRCTKCGSKYSFNTSKRYPMNCPNCGTRTQV